MKQPCANSTTRTSYRFLDSDPINILSHNRYNTRVACRSETCAILKHGLAWCAVLKNVHFWNIFQISTVQTSSYRSSMISAWSWSIKISEKRPKVPKARLHLFVCLFVVCLFFSNKSRATSNVMVKKDILSSALDMTKFTRCQSETCGPDFRSVGLANWHLALKRGACERKISKFGGLWAENFKIWGLVSWKLQNLGACELKFGWKLRLLRLKFPNFLKGGLVNWLFCLKWDPCERQERREKGVFRAAHPHTPFLGQCPPPGGTPCQSETCFRMAHVSEGDQNGTQHMYPGWHACTWGPHGQGLWISFSHRLYKPTIF